MAMSIIDTLEIVHIQHDAGEWLFIAASPLELRIQPLVQISVVIQAGQRIAAGQAIEPLNLGGELRDDFIACHLSVSIIPGIMPIPSYQGLLKFTSNCGASIPKRVRDIFQPLDGDDEASYKAGIDFAVEQCQELLDGGAPGLRACADIVSAQPGRDAS